jgi:hypothetical protein
LLIWSTLLFWYFVIIFNIPEFLFIFMNYRIQYKKKTKRGYITIVFDIGLFI